MEILAQSVTKISLSVLKDDKFEQSWMTAFLPYCKKTCTACTLCARVVWFYQALIVASKSTALQTNLAFFFCENSRSCA